MRIALALIVAGTAATVAAPQSFATPMQSSFYAGGHAAQICAVAAASAQTKGSATAAQLNACTNAIRMAGDSDARLAAAYTNRAILRLVRSEYVESLSDSTSALQIDNQLPEAMVNRGVALLLTHRPNEAAADFTHALALNPEGQAKIYFNRAMAREDAGDLNSAYADYRRAAQIDPQWDRPRQELSRFTVVPKAPLS